ncbi:hypothetical protein [Paenibacillus sp. O199]|uniref:hypothetical protein n=1 Tax=Paenibacillus sp. O199 TaxID=1643925 RepID=UPI0007BF0711|nr:hypothetical protein [Paenibacillus sp. O199]
MSLQIKDETVYVIYRNDQPYEARGRKLVYTSKGAANGVVTKEAYDEARLSYKGDWYELSNSKRETMTEKVKKEFNIVKYGQRGMRIENFN